MLVDQLTSIRDVAPSGCQPAYLITEVLFLAMLQVIKLLLAKGFRRGVFEYAAFSPVVVEQGIPVYSSPPAKYTVDFTIPYIISKYSITTHFTGRMVVCTALRLSVQSD